VSDEQGWQRPEDDEIAGPTEVAGEPVAEIGKRPREVGDDVAGADGSLDIPPVPQAHDHDERLGDPGEGDGGVGTVAGDGA
jgi:hypothetical protein